MGSSRPLKICLLKSSLKEKGGLEKYAWRIAGAFAKKGAEVTFLTSHQPSQENPLPLHFEIFSQTKQGSLGRVREFDKQCLKWLDKHSYDVIFGLDRNTLQTHCRAGNGVHKVFLSRLKAFDPLYKKILRTLSPMHRTLLHMEKVAFERPELKILFTNSHMVKKDVLKSYNVEPDKIRVVHNGVEWTEMQHDFKNWVDQKNKFAAAHAIDPQPFQFLFVGSGFNRKGLRLLLEALALLKRKDFHLSIVGKDKNLREYVYLAQKLGLHNRVTFFGPLSNVRPLYQFSDCLVIPSLYDPFANVTLEALSMGLFVLSSKYNGGREILSEENGLVIPELSDKESFATALLRAMDYPKTWIRSQAIRESVKNFDFPNQLEKIVSITEESLSP